MIPRRIAQHLKQQHWTGVVIELVIVVLGVFIGLQVDNWNQARQDRAAEGVYLHALVRDLDAIQSSLQAQVEFEDSNAHYINQTLDAIEASPSRDRQMRLAMLLTALSARSTLKIESPTFQELQSSGRLGLIRNVALRGKIVNYFFLIRRWESAVDQNNAMFIDSGYNVFLRSHGVALVMWDPVRMHEPIPFGSTLGTVFRHQMESHFGKRLPLANNAILTSPPGSPFWNQLRQQLAWRAHIGGYNQVIALHVKSMTSDLKVQIIGYLKKHPR